MRRLCIVPVLAVLATLGLAVEAPAAASLAFPQHTVSGSFGVTSLDINFYFDPSCMYAVLLDMGVQGDIAPFGESTIATHTCSGGVRPPETSFTLTSALGTLTGTVPILSVSILAPPPVTPPPTVVAFHLELAIAGGTGLLSQVTGTIVLDVTLYSTPYPTPPGTASGTVTGPPIPTQKTDCTNANWKTVVDDQVQPFKNQGQCVEFLQHQRA